MTEINTNSDEVNNYNQNSENMTNETRNMRFEFFGVGSIIIACIYTFCMYKNTAGITAPLIVASITIFLLLCLKEFNIKVRKDTRFYLVGANLLGISICMTASPYINLFSKVGILLLFFIFMISHFYEEKEWSFWDYLKVGLLTFSDMLLSMNRPVGDWIRNEKGNKRKNGKGKYILLGILIAIPLVICILLLLVSADPLFAEVFKTTNASTVIRNLPGIIILTIFVYFLCYTFLCAVAQKTRMKVVLEKDGADPIIGITFTGIISVIYLVFSAIQVIGLFMGKMKLPESYTYAKYAREGFFQLLAVCIINIIMVLICIRVFKKSNILKTILVVISVCTYIMTASSAYRMIMYVQAYKLTVLRVFVLWALAVIALMMFGVIATIFEKRFPLFRYTVGLVMIFYICLAFGRPDYMIAKYNIKAMKEDANDQNAINADIEESIYYGDYRYLTRLSADCVPAIVSAIEDGTFTLSTVKSDEVLYTDIFYYLDDINTDCDKMNFRTFNFSKNTAKQSLSKVLTEEIYGN